MPRGPTAPGEQALMQRGGRFRTTEASLPIYSPNAPNRVRRPISLLHSPSYRLGFFDAQELRGNIVQSIPWTD
ncbi:hypothetical protein CBOM_05694 [Ceraceosorus bombacis]|uniref:Uncharacterized protein n=1 Tax=Ceraceosorus bombacis TaxID=401625 RepID=A0A0P1BQ93_9BASI|nr:hypothetical protein CBOM_05694 [Ceraceosorus bombacis]